MYSNCSAEVLFITCVVIFLVQEEMMKAKFEAQSKTKELMEVHGAWYPPWLAGHLIRYRSFIENLPWR